MEFWELWGRVADGLGVQGFWAGRVFDSGCLGLWGRGPGGLGPGALGRWGLAASVGPCLV